jgi:hypothetical protein
MNRIRLATPDECEAIKDKSDLDATCTVFALDMQRGVGTAVRRIETVLDPMISPPEWGLRERQVFKRDLETVMTAQGATSYYFMIPVDEPEWQTVVEKWGAQRVSTAPVFKYKMNL